MKELLPSFHSPPMLLSPPLKKCLLARSPLHPLCPVERERWGGDHMEVGPNHGAKDMCFHGHHLVCPSSAALNLRVVYIPVPQTEPS